MPSRARAVAARLVRDAADYPDLVSEQLLDAGFVVAHHSVPRRAHEAGRLTVSRPDELTVMVGGPQRSHDEGALVARELAHPARRRASFPTADGSRCATTHKHGPFAS